VADQAEKQSWMFRVLGIQTSADERAPVSILPEAPEEATPQVLALTDAAERGMPFCEECPSAPLDEAEAADV